jgi:hypothetical protein
MKKSIYTICLTAFIALAVVIVICLLCLANEKRPSLKLEENEGPPSAQHALQQENWREYDSIVKIWPRLKKEEIESIRVCNTKNPEYGYDSTSDFWGDVGDANTFGYRERAANIVRWWPSGYKIPKENLPECIKIIDKAVKKAGRFQVVLSLSHRMLIVTKKGKYIVHVDADPFFRKVVEGREWESPELGEFIAKYCIPAYKRNYFIPSKEQVVAIAIFSYRHRKDRRDSQLVWPPVALFGDKNEAEKLLNRSFEPKMIFEGRGWLEKIVDAHETAFREAREANYRIEDSAILKNWIVFLTQDKFYWEGIGIDDDLVVGEYIKESKQLKTYFDEIGLTKELLAGEPNEAAQN